jgi:pimeloyl-ACP methyl ester carboxylesterase
VFGIGESMFGNDRMMRAVGALLLCVVPCGASVSADVFDPGPYLHPQQVISVGKHAMNLYCTGHGSPTVVLGTDGDDPTSAWRFVQPIVARTTRVCSYDPPGFGFSAPYTIDRDADGTVTDLHTLLTRAGITGRLVIVGYSNSGLSARVYADRYARDVAGMVLVSPDIPNQDRRFSSIAPTLAPMLDIDAYLSECLSQARAGTIRSGTPAYARCTYSPPDPTIPSILLHRIHRQWQSADLWSSFAAEQRAVDRSSAEVLREQRAYGHMPLIVLTTIGDISHLPLPANQKTALTKAWISWHEQIAKLSSQGVDFVVPDSTQAIPIDRPTMVASAIDEVVDQSRSK